MCEESITDRMIIPRARAVDLLQHAPAIYAWECKCRRYAHHQLDGDWQVCMLFPNAPEKKIEKALPITQEEALTIITDLAEQQVIYNLFYSKEDRKIAELCSCCQCCCEPIKQMKLTGDYDEQVRSEYVAVTEPALCSMCETCLASCFFEARQMDTDSIMLKDELCFGCGLCVETCPNDAIHLEIRPERGIKIPTRF